MRALTGAEIAALGVLALTPLRAEGGILPAAHVGLQATLLLQIVGGAALAPGAAEVSARLLVPERRLPTFLSFVFVLAAAPALFDPGARRIRAFTDLDSAVDIALSVVLPPLLTVNPALPEPSGRRSVSPACSPQPAPWRGGPAARSRGPSSCR